MAGAGQREEEGLRIRHRNGVRPAFCATIRPEMMDQPTLSTHHNRNLLLGAVVVTALCAYRLMVTAAETGNWRGAWFSLAHVVIVAVGSVLALRETR